MHTHPDIVEMRERYDRMAEQPTAQLTDGLMMVAGLYAAASAWIIGFADQMPLVMSNLICGVAIAVLGMALGSAYGRTHGLAFVAPLLGLWLIVSPWLVSGVTTTTSMIWSHIIAGAVVCVLGLLTTMMGTDRLNRTR
ncbi:SPW repeat protein [Rhodococcus sp. Z13]|uniref:SPW repeat protein n=1 Tax=Rhodococcus sacchari TaxID=2962047 RepID=A0ACD4DM51_9NOCA|nr:SPW repeat protein [Rhodococcus sp. Z13]UYP21097.1 SPW repeat protein [Rhodococcus sp. Z13]